MNKCKSTVVRVVLITVFLSVFPFFTGCSKKTSANRIVIWTSCREFAQYIEYYNRSHQEDNAILVYKENPALSLSQVKDEEKPDIVVASWLPSDSTQKNFISLDYLFDHQQISTSMFYSQLLQVGKVRQSQYLLPVSFNLPAVIFSLDNSSFVTDSYTLSLEQIRSIASSFNQKNSKGVYTKIGFAPLGNNDFLYLVTKLFNADFHQEKNRISWNQTQLDKSLAYLKDWIISENTSAQTESDFTFKYLFMPYYRQVTSGRTLFAYTSSDEFFKVMKDQNHKIDYRWICNDGSIPINDSYTMMGIYKKSRNKVGAANFLLWFFQPQTQKEILERKESLGLQTEFFGIAGGFSSVREVNEHILPTFYTQMLSNLPPAQMLSLPNKLPAQWVSYRRMVVEEYLQQNLNDEDGNSQVSMKKLEEEWRKKVFN